MLRKLVGVSILLKQRGSTTTTVTVLNGALTLYYSVHAVDGKVTKRQPIVSDNYHIMAFPLQKFQAQVF